MMIGRNRRIAQIWSGVIFMTLRYTIALTAGTENTSSSLALPRRTIVHTMASTAIPAEITSGQPKYQDNQLTLCSL